MYVRVLSKFINGLVDRSIIVSSICAGVDVVDNAGVLKGIKSTHSEDERDLQETIDFWKYHKRVQ